MAVITQFPRGLVSLTGLRDMGEAPRDLSDVIAPSIDITQFLLLNRETLYASGNPSTVTQVSLPNQLVPPGELWYVHSFSVSALCAAGQTIALQTGFITQGEAFHTGLPARATAGHGCGAYQDGPIWIGPGVGLCAHVNEIVSGPVGVGLRAVISRLRI